MGPRRADWRAHRQPDRTWLQGMREGSIVILAIIMGLMLAFDMGGPVNKVAYAFMLICVSQGVYSVVAIAAVGIAVPPLGMGLATLIGRKYFSRGGARNR